MKSQHWQNFTPGTSEVRNFIGGIRGWNEFHDVNGEPRQLLKFAEVDSNSSVFGSISYELRVAAAQNGWHHSLSYTRGATEVSRSADCMNGILKSFCRPGVYQMLLHFQDAVPKSGPMAGVAGNFTQAINPTYPDGLSHWLSFPSGPSTVDPEMVNEYFAIRLHLFSPSSGADIALWNSAAYRGQFNLSGYPITKPDIVNPY